MIITFLFYPIFFFLYHNLFTITTLFFFYKICPSHNVFSINCFFFTKPFSSLILFIACLFFLGKTILYHNFLYHKIVWSKIISVSWSKYFFIIFFVFTIFFSSQKVVHDHFFLLLNLFTITFCSSHKFVDDFYFSYHKGVSYIIFNRPVVAGAVLQTPPLLGYSLTH